VWLNALEATVPTSTTIRAASDKETMTIAIGIRASDGIIIAADREEGDGYLTNDRGKILQTFRGIDPIGWISIAGAGDGPAIDEVAKLLTNRFCADTERTAELVKAALRNEHRAYYKTTILPFARMPQLERPDYALIIGCLEGGVGKSLFFTSRLSFNESNDYEAVGVGATVANNWLGRLYEYMPVSCAIRLAAYVIYQVKNSVRDCGLGTDIIVLKRGKLLDRVNPDLIRKWEAAFRYYPSLERNVFSHCIGVGPMPSLLRTKPDMKSVKLGINKMRKALMLSEEKAQSTRSASRKSEPEP
jgi:20S proteasome alpha/beta subunit